MTNNHTRRAAAALHTAAGAPARTARQAVRGIPAGPRTSRWWRRVVAAGAGGMLAAGMMVAAAAGPAAAGTAPMLAFTPSPSAYGQVTVGQTASQTFTLANSGGMASRALTVTLPGPAGFTITADTCTGTSLGPGKSCTVTVRFAPAAAGTATAALTAASDKTVLATDSLSGTGVLPGHLYWTDFIAGTVTEANLDGSNPQVIVSGQTSLSEMAVDGSHIYWSDLDAGTIVEANLDGTGVQTLVSGQEANGVAVDGSHLYWASANVGTIMEANLDGTGVTTLVTGQNSPAGVAVSP